MSTPQDIAEESLLAALSEMPESLATEWCSTHLLIEQLSAVQRRIGTPLERPEDVQILRSLGRRVSEKLDTLRPSLRVPSAASQMVQRRR